MEGNLEGTHQVQVATTEAKTSTEDLAYEMEDSLENLDPSLLPTTTNNKVLPTGHRASSVNHSHYNHSRKSYPGRSAHLVKVRSFKLDFQNRQIL